MSYAGVDYDDKWYRRQAEEELAKLRKQQDKAAKLWKEGYLAGRASAYIGFYDQYDRGSLMFKPTENPYG